MKCSIVIFGFVVLIMVAANAKAFVFSSSHNLETTISENTTALFIGNIVLNGTFYGYPLDIFDEWQSYIEVLSNLPLTTIFGALISEDMYAFPLLGMTTFHDVENVRLINTSLFDEINDYEDLLDMYDAVQVFTDVDVIVQKGLAILGTTGIPIQIYYESDLSVSSFAQMPITSDESLSVLGMISDSPVQFEYAGNTSVLMSPTKDTSIVISDSNGTILWKSNSQDMYYVLQDDVIAITDNSFVHLFPVEGGQKSCSLHLSVKPTSIQETSVNALLDQLIDISVQYGNLSIPYINDNNSFISDFLPVISQVLNGGLVLVHPSNSVVIDGSFQRIVNIGFARSNHYDVVIPPSNPSVRMIYGDFRLVFLGDHFYSSQAPQSTEGLTLPFLPVALWVSAVVVFLLFHFVLHSRYLRRSYPQMRKISLIVYLMALFIVFIILDREVSYQLGCSMFDILFSQGFSMLFFGFLAFHLIVYGLGFIACALPMGILANQVMKYFGFDKHIKGFGNAVGALMILVFAAVYMTVILNVLCLFIKIPPIV
ncbi:MAG: hypothetical protein V1769_02835 [Thermoplasmatota archaeon]